MRNLFKHMVLTALVTTVLAASTAASLSTSDAADAAFVPTAGKYVYTLVPGDGSLDTTPNLVPIVDCYFTQAGSTTITYWFGYNLAADIANYDVPVDVAPGPSNSFVERDATGAIVSSQVNRSQITNFQPGSHRRMFGVRVNIGNRPTWTLYSDPAAAGLPGGGYYKIEVTPWVPPACPAGFGGRSAVPQAITGASVAVTPMRFVRDAAGTLTGAKLNVVVSGVTSACSRGGIPLAPSALWGYLDMTSGGGPNLVPVDPASVTRTDTFYPVFGTPVNVDRTTSSVRTILDTQHVFMSSVGVVSHGFTGVRVVVDVTARCQFTVNGVNVIQKSAATHWVTPFGTPQQFTFQTSAAAPQSLVVACTLGPTCPVNLGIGPGGTRYR